MMMTTSRLKFTAMIVAALTFVMNVNKSNASLLSATATTSGNNVVLDSVTTTGGTFTQAQFIGVDVTHFSNSSTTWIVRPEGDALPSSGNRAALFEDFSLSTVLANPGGSATTGISSPAVINDPTPANNTPGMAFNFLQPIRNVAGQVDIVLFEIATNTQTGDPFALSLLDGSASKAYVASNYSVLLAGTTLRTATGTAPLSLAQLESNTLTNAATAGVFEYRGIGIDLSDLGVPVDGSVTGLFLTSGSLDPGLVIGLHPVPEPSMLIVAGLGLAGFWGLRRKWN
jgi:hypothetical protein